MDQIEIHWVWWVIAAVGLGVLEILTLDLVLLMFATGAVAALVASLLGGDITVQVLAFAATSTVMLVFLRPFLLRNLRRRTPLVETNAAANVGRTALTLSEVTDRSGLVKLAGEQWSARTDVTGLVLAADVTVRVLRIDGATAVVGPLQQPAEDPPDAPGTSP
ncbi:NfeD family protein [Actinotalea sp. Marseille-Q4924]|uniref:NfeD family protein n=1 Tax=Actinotalea sp. Marseille-Q4924 TaxID=2866571 RepID=UPI001CE4324A|nr:NfeD family protein [Actinotalea sp. Marseille-Q4924]